MNASNTGGGQSTVWTKDSLAAIDKSMEIERGRLQILKQKDELDLESVNRLTYQKDILSQISQEETIIYQERSNAQEAFDQGALTQQEYDELDLKARKELLAIDKERKGIADQQRQDKLTMIRDDFRLSNVEKYDQQRAILEKNGTPEEIAKLGPNPHSFADQWKATITDLKNQMGTFQQSVATSFKTVFNSAISSISDGISGLIMGTKSLGQAMMDIGKSILTSIITAIVEMGVRWVATRLLMLTTDTSVSATGLA